MGRRWTEEALALSRTLGDERGIALSLFQTGADAVSDGDWQTATALLTESLERFRHLGYRYWVPWITRTLAWNASRSGDLQRARELYEQGLDAAREIGSRAAEAALLGALGWLAILAGHPRDALPLYAKSLTLRRAIDDREEMLVGLTGASRALALTGDPVTAVKGLASAASTREELGTVGEDWVERDREDALEAIHAHLDEAAFAQAWEEGSRLALDDAVGLTLEALSLLAETGD
jgi:tetratricopeptide (TPR) repeat protein